jgi:type I restriction enzyme, S subunit
MNAFAGSPWALSKLRDVCGHKEACDPTGSPTLEFAYVDIASVCNATFEVVSPKRLLGRNAPSRARKRIRSGDIVVATTRPYLRSIARIPNELDGQVCSTGFCVLRPTRQVISDWIFFAALSQDFVQQLTLKMRGASYPAVTDRDVLDVRIPLPRPNEQSRIVARIRECMTRVVEIEGLRAASLTEQQSLSASLIESELHPDLAGQNGWAERTVGEVVTTVRNGRSIAQDTEGRANGAVLTLTAVRSIALGLDYQKPVALSDDVARQFSIEEGDVFVSRANTIGLVGLAAVAMEKPSTHLIYPDLLIKLKADRSLILPRYLAYSLRSASARKQIKARALGSSQTMVKISGERLREVVIPVPSLVEQEQIIDRLDSAHALIQQLAAEVLPGEVEALRAAILRKAFAGEL